MGVTYTGTPVVAGLNIFRGKWKTWKAGTETGTETGMETETKLRKGRQMYISIPLIALCATMMHSSCLCVVCIPLTKQLNMSRSGDQSHSDRSRELLLLTN